MAIAWPVFSGMPGTRWRGRVEVDGGARRIAVAASSAGRWTWAERQAALAVAPPERLASATPALLAPLLIRPRVVSQRVEFAVQVRCNRANGTDMAGTFLGIHPRPCDWSAAR